MADNRDVPETPDGYQDYEKYKDYEKYEDYEELDDEDDESYAPENDVLDDDLDDYEEDDPEDTDIVIRFKPWMIPAFAGMMILAILICIPLWKLTHHGNTDPGSGELVAAVTETQTTEAETAFQTEPAATTAPEVAATPEPTPNAEEATVTTEAAAAPTEAPTATPEAQPAVTETPTATEIPDNSAVSDPSNTLAEGKSMTFGDVNETVTAKDVTNLRNIPYTGDDDNVVGQLKNGETLSRTGRNDSTGWSRLEYNGQIVYAVTAYLTTDLTYKTPEKPSNPNRVSTQDGRVIIFTDCDDYITPKELINLRTEPSTSEGDSTVRTQIQNGTNLHRTGYSQDSGWSRVEYNGEVLYAVTSYVISGSAPE